MTRFFILGLTLIVLVGLSYQEDAVEPDRIAIQRMAKDLAVTNLNLVREEVKQTSHTSESSVTVSISIQEALGGSS